MKTLSLKSVLPAVTLIFIMLLLVIKPSVYMQATLSGLLLWLNNVLPALFPFFFFSGLLLKLDVVSKLGNKLEWLTHKLFHCSGGAGLVFLISIISGYPVGARVTSDLYKSKMISQAEVCRINAFGSTSGPLFVVGAVGVGMLHSHVAGIILLISHYLGAILNGICYRNYRYTPTKVHKMTLESHNSNLTEAMYSSIISILLVGGYIVIFFILIEMLSNIGFLKLLANLLFFLPSDLVTGFFSGIIEVTTGCELLSHVSSLFIVPLVCALISWGGISIHAQALTFLSPCGMKSSIFFLQKFTQSIISFGICFFFSFCFL